MLTKKRKNDPDTSPSKRMKLQELVNLPNAIKYINNHGTNKKKSDKDFVLESLKTIRKCSVTVGLLPPDMIQIIENIANPNLGDKYKRSLIPCLVPSSVIPLEAIHIMLSFITSQKCSITLKAKIMDWMIAMFDVIQYKETLNKFYDLFFYFAQYSTLCRYSCHLLFLITQREDVRPFWVRRLKAIESMMGAQPYIHGLFSIYQMYRPDLVTLQPHSSYKRFFTTSRIWTERLHKVQSSNASTLRQSVLDCTQFTQFDFIKDVHKELQKTKNTRKGTRNEVLPAMRSVNFDDDLQDKVPYQQINTFQQMIDNLHKLQLPSRIASVLKYRAVRMIVLSKADPTIIPRLNSWIKGTMLREFIFHKREEAYEIREQLLGSLVELTEDIQEGIPCMEEVLGQYLMTWNGYEHRTKILALISKWRICPYDQLEAMVLDPLRRLYYRCSVFFKCSVLDCFTQMIHHMAMIELARYSCAAFRHNSMSENKNVNLYFRSIFSSVVYAQMDVLDMLGCLIKFVVKLADAGLKLHHYHPLLVHHVLCLYETLNQLHPVFGIPKVVSISRAFMYHSLFSLDASVLSRTFSILASSNSTIDTINQNRFNGEKQVIKDFSSDIIDTLWNSLGFIPVANSGNDKQRSIYGGKYATTQNKLSNSFGVRKNKAGRTFSIFKHPALLNFSCQFLNLSKECEIEETLMLSENKKKFVLFLQEKNFVGFNKFQQEFQTKET